MNFNSIERRKQRIKWYSSTAWKKKRARQLEKQGLCEMCFDAKPRRLVLATIADHIDPDFDTFGQMLSGETQSLCEACHREKTSFIDIPLMKRKQKLRIEVSDV